MRVPLPGLSANPLGRIMERSDHTTTADILHGYCLDVTTRDEVAEYLAGLRADQLRRKMSRRERTEDPDLPLAVALLERMRAYHRGEERRLLDQGSTMTWRQLEQHWPGRVWFSLRDDYERVAERFYRAEQLFICELSENVVKVGKMRDRVHV